MAWADSSLSRFSDLVILGILFQIGCGFSVLAGTRILVDRFLDDLLNLPHEIASRSVFAQELLELGPVLGVPLR
jgi:hypothetical protein